jgi:hypothetical protein
MMKIRFPENSGIFAIAHDKIAVGLYPGNPK